MSRRRVKPGVSRRKALGLAAVGGLGLLVFNQVMRRDDGQAADVEREQIVLGFAQEPTVFNPHLMHYEADEGVHYAVFDTLFRVDPAGELVPSLCVQTPTVENGGISLDGLEWRVKLRDDVVWHDGKPFTAEDVKFTLELMADPGFRAWRRAGYDLIRDVRVVSPTEVVWRMERFFAPLTSILAVTFILPKHAFDGVKDKNTAPFNSAPIGTGPYRLARRVPGDHIELVANPNYFGDGPYLKRFIIKYIPDLTVLYTQFRTGLIDVVGISWIQPDNYKEAKQLKGRVVEIMPSALIECFTFNTALPQLSDVNVRRAVYHAMDKDGIVNYLYHGLPTPTESYVPRESYFYNHDLPRHEYSLEKARQILEDAGWLMGPDGVRRKDGMRLSFSNSAPTGNNLREQLQQFLQQSLKMIGVEMKIVNMPPAVLFGEFSMLSKFETVIHGQEYLVGSDPDPSNFFRSGKTPVQGGDGLNICQYANPEADRLMDLGLTTMDREARREIYLKVQEVIRNDLPFLPIYQRARVGGFKAGIVGVEGNVNVRIDTWNVNTWRWS